MNAPTVSPLHCRCSGHGLDCVLLHGWGLHAGIWEPVVESLAARAKLHLYDLPGHGHSTHCSAFTLDDACAALAQSAPEQADWIGWSLGGMLALEFAARYPQRVRRLILVASNPRFVTASDWPHAMAPDVLEDFARALESDYDDTVKRFLALVARGAPDNGVLRSLRNALRQVPQPTIAGLRSGLEILRSADLRARLRSVAVPVLLQGGTRDSLVPIAALRELAELHFNVRLHEIVDAGHAPFLSHPHSFIDSLTEFLA